MWDKMDWLIDGPHRHKTMAVWIAYLALNLGVMAAYCYQITPQWHIL
jgi:hypothetical protein